MNSEESDISAFINSYMKEESINVSENYVVGIDLGTTNSCVAIWRNNNLEIIPDENGENTIPSYVGYTKVNRYIGTEAKNQKEINPKNVFYEFKRLIGRKVDDESIINDKEFFNFDIVPDDKNNVNVITDFKKQITPEELSAIILQRLKENASRYLKSEVTKAVITVPAYFNDSQRQATKDAAQIAGLECIRIINEPTSAALTYGLLNKSLSDKCQGESINVIVYDFGGGTLDISLLTITDGLFEVKASVGNTHLGGADFDNKIISYCINYFKKTNNIEKLNDLSSLSFQRLKKACENAKKILSVSLKTNIIVPDFYNNKDLVLTLTRERLNIICRDLLIIALKPLEDILVSAKLTKEDIHEVILVGGMTRMPQIVENIKKFFNNKEPNCSMNPEEVVAAGAAIQAYILSHDDDPFSNNVTLLDIIPLSLGIETIGGVMNTLIARNTIIPITKRKIYTTDSDYESSVLIKVFEGERKMTKDNFLVGEFELEGLEPAPRGFVRIEVKFNIDINGIITVTAEDITDKDRQASKKSITITGNKGRLRQDQISKLIDEARQYELKDKILKKKKELYYEIDEMTTNIKINLKNDQYKLCDKDKEYLEAEITKYRNWLVEKKYFDREESEYKETIQDLSKKFGTLILKATKTKDVDSLGMKVKATTVYGNEEEDAEINKENYDTELAEDDELGIRELDENEKKEIKLLKNNLIELAHSIFELINNNDAKLKDKINQEDRGKLIDFIDDALLWSYTVNKPKQIDFINKINDINNECNKLFEKYQDIFNQDTDTEIEKLEKLCYNIKSSILCGIYIMNNDYSTMLIENTDKYLEEIEMHKLDIYQTENIQDKNKKIDIFSELCKKYIEELNIQCSKIEKDIIIKDIGIELLNQYNNSNNEGTCIADLLKE